MLEFRVADKMTCKIFVRRPQGSNSRAVPQGSNQLHSRKLTWKPKKGPIKTKGTIWISMLVWGRVIHESIGGYFWVILG